MQILKYTLFLLIVSTSFAQQGKMQEKQKIANEPIKRLLPGLDTKTVLKSDSIFAQAMVSQLSEKIAKGYFTQASEMKGICDSLWLFMKEKDKTHADSVNGFQCYSRAVDYLSTAPYELHLVMKRAKKVGRLDSTVIKEIVTYLIPQISKTYGNAIRYNRFSVKYRFDFANFLNESYNKTGDIAFIDQAIEQHRQIIRLKRGLRESYVALGELYFIRKQWSKAFENYRKAAEILEKSAIFVQKDPTFYFDRLTEVPFDTSRMVKYLFRQAECKIHLYEPQPALALLRKARKLTPDPRLKDRFKSKIKWILWDDGNIRATELRDQAFATFNNRQYENAKIDLIKLLDILWTQRTKDEINYRIAQIDFSYLKNEGDGVARLFQVIKHSKRDSLTGAAADSMCQQYFDSYGKMCFKLGSDYLDKNLTYAFIYFMQAANIVYDEQPKAYIQLAALSTFKPRESIKLCKKALEKINYLDDVSREALYGTLYEAYRKLGDFSEARKWFDKSQSN